MAYENTVCPCGSKKEANTMLCDDCIASFGDRPEMGIYQDKTFSTEYRRNAAIILVTLAKGRRRVAA